MRPGDLALVGMACALEGGADIDSLWATWMDGGAPGPGGAKRADELVQAALADAGVCEERDAERLVLESGETAQDLAVLRRAWTRLAGGGGGPLVVVASGVALAFESACAAAARGASPWAILALVSGTDEQALRSVYARHEIPPDTIGLLEAGGTGDLSSLRALLSSGEDAPWRRPFETSTRRDDAEAAPFVHALVKVALCLSHKLVAPMPVEAVKAPARGLPVVPLPSARPWVHDPSLGPRRAAVHQDLSQVGLHVVLEEVGPGEAARGMRPRPIRTGIAWPSELFVLDAASKAELAARVEEFCESLPADGSMSFVELARSGVARTARSALPARLAIVARDLGDLGAKLAVCRARLAGEKPTFGAREDVFFSSDVSQDPGKVACLFPGLAVPGLQGAYAEHLLDLALRFPVVREVLDGVERRGTHLDDPVPTSHLLFPPAALPEATRTAYGDRWAIPTRESLTRAPAAHQSNLCHFGVTIANLASWRVLEALGVHADMLFGQSQGDASALAAAGALEFGELLHVHATRHVEAKDVPFDCTLAIVKAEQDRLDEILIDFPEITVAMYLSPRLQLVGGQPEAVERLVGTLRAQSVLVQSLPYPAAHTKAFTGILAIVADELARLTVRKPDRPVYSGITTEPHPDDVDAIRRNVLHNIDMPVRLWQTLRAMYDDGARVFLQMGDGGSMLHRFARTAPGAGRRLVAASMDLDYRPAITQLNVFCAQLWTSGVAVDLGALHAHRAPGSTPALDRGAAAASLDAPALPFFGRVLGRGQGWIEVERVLDLAVDRHLADHLFIRAGGDKPESARLPILPLMFSLEVIAEIASVLAPGYGLIGFEDVRATRWIDLRDTTRLPLRIRARARPADDTTTRRIDAAVHVPGGEGPAVQGVVLFDHAYRADLDFPLDALGAQRPHPYSAEEIYARCMLWHGPLLQSIQGRPTLAERAIVGELEVLSPEGLFAGTRRPVLLLDPVVLDAVGQLLGLWCLEQGERPFPIGIEKLELYCPTPPVGTRCPTHVQVTQRASRFVTANAEVQDGTGHVWMRVRGLRDWNYRWPAHNQDVRERPREHLLGHVLPVPAPGTGLVIEVSEADVFDSDLSHIARIYLTHEEMERFEALETSPERLPWLLGRIAVKDAVRMHLADASGAETMPHPASFAIETLPGGAPVVRGIASRRDLHVSISHVGARAIGAAHTTPVGIDIERIEERGEGFGALMSTSRERNQLAEQPPEEHAVWITRLWCAKEAAGKALGVGMSEAPRDFEATPMDAPGRFLVEHRPSARALCVDTHVANGFVYATAVDAVSTDSRG